MDTMRRRLTGHLRLLGWAAALAPLAMVGVPLFVLQVTFTPLLVVTVGLPALMLVVPWVRGYADFHRRWAGRMLAEEIPSPYRPRREGSNWLGYLPTLLGDPATWRDLVWLLVNATAGFTLCVLAVALHGAIAWYAVFPLLYAVTPHGVFDANYGLFRVDSQLSSFFLWWFGLVAAGLAWYCTRPLLVAYAHVVRWLLAPTANARLAGRVRQLTESRADTVDSQAAELRRIERDLHDGAQARLVALGMSLGMAEELVAKDPGTALRLLAEARQANSQALAELREVVRGIHPPVLAERGLAGAVRALAAANPLPISVDIDLPGTLSPPVESAAYFAVAEMLTNISKHSGAGQASVRLHHTGDRLSIQVADNGRGGADPEGGTGLRGIQRRLAAFDGTLTVTSPTGGPTVVTMELPCELSSRKTSPSSGTA
ncbi:MAG: sensor histidine kinase [Mycobacteriales bacterium]